MNPDHSFSLGTLTLPSSVIYSPLAGCSDYPFRKMVKKHSPRIGLFYCEMVKAEPLVLFEKNTLRLLDYDSSMHPIGAQIVGSNKEKIVIGAKILEDLGFDVIDFNCGCPVDKVTKDGSGSGMLKHPDQIASILRAMTEVVNIPITVKIRSGWDETTINVAEITRLAEEAGAQAIAVHGRTRKQGYKGPANWDYIKEAKEVATTIKVMGNGDVFSPEAAEKMMIETSCDAVLVSRGGMGAPWLGEDILLHREGKEVHRSFEEELIVLKEHWETILAYRDPKRAVLDFRRIGCWYVKNNPYAREYRKKICKARDIDSIWSLLKEIE